MEYMRNKRLGEIRCNNQGELMIIIDYCNSHNILIKFVETGTVKKCAYKEFKNGSITDNFYPSVFGVGYIGNTSVVESKRKVKDSYKRWADMLCRCYSKHQKLHPSYIGCSVCDEWLCYENFEKWYNKNYYIVDNERMHLDKDILVKGNKLYSPDTCIFVPMKINSLFTNCKAVRGEYPIGVTRSKKNNKFEPQVQGCGWLGYYNTPEEAFYVYKENKEKRIKEIAEQYKDKIPLILYNALYDYKVYITD